MEHCTESTASQKSTVERKDTLRLYCPGQKTSDPGARDAEGTPCAFDLHRRTWLDLALHFTTVGTPFALRSEEDERRMHQLQHKVCVFAELDLPLVGTEFHMFAYVRLLIHAGNALHPERTGLGSLHTPIWALEFEVQVSSIEG